MARYAMDVRYIEKYDRDIAQGRAVAVPIRDNQALEWKNVNAQISETDIKGGDSLELITYMGRPRKQEWYIKIIDELPDDNIVTLGEHGADR